MVKEILKYSIIEIIYLVASIIYMVFLNLFNKELMSIIVSNNYYIQILTYKNGRAIYFFIVAAMMIAFGGYRIVKHIKSILHDNLNLMEILMSLLIVIVMLILIIGIIILIDNPILKAIFIVGITGYIYSGVT